MFNCANYPEVAGAELEEAARGGELASASCRLRTPLDHSHSSQCEHARPPHPRAPLLQALPSALPPPLGGSEDPMVSWVPLLPLRPFSVT